MTTWKKRFSVAFAIYSAFLITAMLAYLLANRDVVEASAADLAQDLITVASFSFLAAFLFYHRPDHKISLLLLLVALFQQMRLPSEAADIALLSGAEPTFGLLFWASLWINVGGLAYILLAYIFVLFPNGRLPSPRFRLAGWLLAFLVLVSAGQNAIRLIDAARAFAGARATGAQIVLTPMADGPLGVQGLHVREFPQMGTVSFFLFALAGLLILMALLSQVVRFRRGSGIERQQIKWVLLIMVVWLAALLPIVLLPGIRPFLLLLFSPLLPLAIALPILRYRLWDIDVIIRRTLLYTLLTLMLGAVYLGSVVLLQQLLTGVTDQRSPLIIVISTLFIAALFQPLRRRLQRFIDRRFYRRKYDAAQTLARFAATARDEVDVDQLAAELQRVVEETMQPESVSIWLQRRRRDEPPAPQRS